MSQNQQDAYASAQKEMEMLLKLEGGIPNPFAKGGAGNRAAQNEMAAKVGKGSSPSNRLSGEYATRVKGKPSGASGYASGEEAMRLQQRSGSGLVPQPGAPPSGTQQFEPGFAISDLMGPGELVTADSIIRSLSEKTGLPYRDFRSFDLSDEDKVKRLISYIPSSTARERRIFPVEERSMPGGQPVLTIAIYDPLNVTIVDDLRLMLPEHEIEVVVCAEQDIIDAIDRHYGVGEEKLDTVIDQLSEEESATGEKSSVMGGGAIDIDLATIANAPPVIKLVNLLLIQAIQDRASDLHIEPFGTSIRIRYRVDGVLREIPSPPKTLQVGLITRLKVMAGMNISENRVAQDGRIRLSINGREIDLRVSCTPTVHGESMVMRILDKSNMMIGIAQLGMQAEVLEKYLKTCNRPNGIILLTGPTGCGKTTTLYSTLMEIYDPGAKFITTEDPVEYELPGIVQVNINAAVGLTFAACLRSILRQDPDVILLGEMRDVETGQIGVQAALTGHLVFSTLHTNSAALTVTRLIDMGIEPFLLTSTLQMIGGQRLVRTICQRCKTIYVPTDEELAEYGVTRSEVSDISFFQGRGCEECNMTGYRGRIGLYEVLHVTDTIRELVLQRATSDDVHALAVHEGMMTMRQDGWLKICYGVTTFDEVSRQTQPETEESISQERESVRRSLERIARIRRERDEEDAGFDAAHGHGSGGGGEGGDAPVLLPTTTSGH